MESVNRCKKVVYLFLSRLEGKRMENTNEASEISMLLGRCRLDISIVANIAGLILGLGTVAVIQGYLKAFVGIILINVKANGLVQGAIEGLVDESGHIRLSGKSRYWCEHCSEYTDGSQKKDFFNHDSFLLGYAYLNPLVGYLIT